VTFLSIRILIQTSDETQILKLLNHLNKELIKCNSDDKENFVRAFQRIIDELQHRDEDVIVKVVDSFIPSLLNNIKAVHFYIVVVYFHLGQNIQAS
jgi:sulfatase maturation enzyme AslB (radical SAM superfamily)